MLTITLGLGSLISLSSCFKDSDGKIKVGIVQLVEHPALDAATEGFKQAIIDELGADAVRFDYQNAQNDANTCSTIVNQFVSNKVDLIMANATPALQAAAAATAEIPILGTSVTEYGVALELKNVTKTFGSVVANKNVNLTLRKGEILSLLGENGSGKTTLMNMISGIYYPDEGQILSMVKKSLYLLQKTLLNTKSV